MTAPELWARYRTYLYYSEPLGFTLDISRMRFPDTLLPGLGPQMESAFQAMHALEAGTIANPDEGRMVGHYWLRAPERSPSAEIRHMIEAAVSQVQTFAAQIHDGAIAPEAGGKFTHILIIGIGGSALGPQLVADALGSAGDPMVPVFLDNTDPDGVDRVLDRLGQDLERTLTVVISKSGTTPEPRVGMIEIACAYEDAGLSFSRHAVAITSKDSELYKTAVGEGWIATFPMWDWVGGRTSVMSTVGLLPMALQGIDIISLLEGARLMDQETRAANLRHNPAALLAAMWYYACEGRGARDMVVLPYKDRLLLFSRYLQQLVMESLGKEKDLQGRVVHQGISVYGNKGSTDQHAYIQQLRDGVPNFFATFIEVLKDRNGPSVSISPGVTAGDYLTGFLLGTRRALFENGRESITLTLQDVSPRSLGALIALYERAVGLYAHLVGINAYHQPGVEAGKKAASAVLGLQQKLLAALENGVEGTAEHLANVVGLREEAETAFKILEHLAANGRIHVKPGAAPYEGIFMR